MIPDLMFDLLARDLTKPAFKSVEDSAARTDSRVKQIGSSIAGLGARVGRGLSGIAAGLTGLGAGAAAMDWLNAWADADKAMASVDQAVTSTGGAAGLTSAALGEMAAKLQGLSVYDDDDILGNVTAPLLTFTKVAGEEFGRAQGLILDMASLLGTDLQSAAMQVGKALNEPVKGIASLSKAGIQFTADQKEMIKAMVEAGNVAGAQNIILDELATQFGGQAERMAASGLGPLEQMKNAWGDFKEEMGAGVALLLPPVTQFLKAVVGGFQALPEPVKLAIGAFAGGAAIILPVGVALGLVATGIAAIGVPVAATAAGIALLTAGIVAFWPEINAAATAITTFLTGAWASFEAGWDSIVGKVATAKAAVTQFAVDIASAFAALPGEMLAIGGQIIDGLWQGLQSKWAGVKNWLSGIANYIPNIFREATETHSPSQVMHDIGVDIMQGLQNGLSSMTGGVTGTVSSIADQVTGLFENIADSIGQAIASTKSWKDVALDALKAVGNMLMSQISAGGGLGGIFGKLLKGIFGGFFADGGTLRQGQIGVVGEAGPEIISAGSTPVVVTPTDDLRAPRAGRAGPASVSNVATINQAFHLDGAISPSDVLAMVAQGSAAAVAEIKRQLPDMQFKTQMFGRAY
ncbi:phage tail length tape measure family protein [Mesorhizobium sp. J428]|uniref:phage tail length tape measure family protein n=1 Tax=Mesorhizobium sp. J428 TaxID=2898440 RepID=UPI0021517CE3|nr:phage tail length tape measure family protein [Mesorhizobium sp. J428]MCR5859726.1 phage tail length tape measure family protein [Mesorhizobium sp. J428]